jgi:chlorite dismutase
MGARYLVVESRLYGGPEGFSRLIEAVRADPARWRVLAEGPVFVARRVGRAANDP